MSARADHSSAPEWAPEESAPLTELLDHIAAELAAEYVRLMEDADRDRNGTDGIPPESRRST
jgi:hypothetical protein